MNGELAPRRPRAPVTLALGLSWVLVYALSLWLSGGPVDTGSAWTWGAPRQDVLVRLGGAVAPLIRAGDWQRVLAYAFLHGFALHLALNLWVWLAVGRSLEHVVGSWRTLVVFVAAAAGGALAHVALRGGPLPVVGASGGVFGAVGALGVWALASRRPEAAGVRRSVLFFVVLSLLLLLVPGVSHEGHGGGFAAGALTLLLLGPRRAERPAGPLVRGLGVVCLLLLVGAGVVQGAAPSRPRAASGQVERFLRDLEAAERVGERLHEGARYATPSDRADLGRRLDALLETSWLEDYDGHAALEGYVRAWRPVADGDVPDPFAFETALGKARAAWRPYESRLRAEYGVSRGFGR